MRGREEREREREREREKREKENEKGLEEQNSFGQIKQSLAICA